MSESDLHGLVSCVSLYTLDTYIYICNSVCSTIAGYDIGHVGIRLICPILFKVSKGPSRF